MFSGVSCAAAAPNQTICVSCRSAPLLTSWRVQLLRRQKAWAEEKAAKDKEYAAQRAEMAGEHFDKEVRTRPELGSHGSPWKLLCREDSAGGCGAGVEGLKHLPHTCHPRRAALGAMLCLGSGDSG